MASAGCGAGDADPVPGWEPVYEPAPGASEGEPGPTVVSLGTPFVLNALELDPAASSSATVSMAGDELTVPVESVQLRLRSDGREVVVEHLSVRIGQAAAPAGWWVEDLLMHASPAGSEVLAASPTSLSIELAVPAEVRTSANDEEHTGHRTRQTEMLVRLRIDAASQGAQVRLVVQGKSDAPRSESPCCGADAVQVHLGLWGELAATD